MIKPPSNYKPYAEYWSDDPAFESGPVDPGADATDEQRQEYKAALDAYVARLTAAWETGNWQPLRIEGGDEPTKFIVRPLPAGAWAILDDLRKAGIGENELITLAFRIALVSVSNLGSAKVAHVNDDRFGRIASLSFMDEAGLHGSLGLRIVRDIGIRVFNRASPQRPKS